MKNIVLFTVFFAATFICCDASTEEAHAAEPPIYPFWNLAQMPHGPTVARERMPIPTASAVLIAPGWLVTSAEAMGSVAVDLNMDPTVYLFDGMNWYTGRYVDYDRGKRLALIRADVPGIPWLLEPSISERKGHGIFELLAIPWSKALDRPIVRDQFPLSPCESVPDWMVDVGINVVMPTYCFRGKVTTLAGGAFVDTDGNLAGLQVSLTAADGHAGASAADIRDFVRTYFASWGRDVKDKPKL